MFSAIRSKINYPLAIYNFEEVVRSLRGELMRIWLACFFVLFAIAELFDWLKHLSLPMPIYILGGAFLAIASNSNKRWGLFFFNSSAEPPLTNTDAERLNFSSGMHQASPDSKTLVQRK